MSKKLFFGLALFEEKIAKPNLSQMSLVLVSCINLFDSVECLGFKMEAFPNLRETATSKLFSTKIPINERLVLKNRLVMCPPKDRFFILVRGCWIFIILCFVSNLSFACLTLSAISIHWIINYILIGHIIGPFLKTIVLE